MLLRELEARVLTRERGDVTCDQIMSREVISVERDADPALARELLMESGVRLLPVLDSDGRPLGGVGLRELSRRASSVEEVMVPAITVAPSQPIVELVAPLSAQLAGDGHVPPGVSQADR